jgi:hypothetical protein
MTAKNLSHHTKQKLLVVAHAQKARILQEMEPAQFTLALVSHLTMQ